MKNLIVILLILNVVSCKESNLESNHSVASVGDTALLTTEYSSLSLEQLYDYSEVSQKLSDFKSCIPYLEEIIERDSTQGKAYFKLALCYVEQMDYNKSSYLFSKAIRLNYNPEDCYFNIAFNYFTIGNFDSTIICLEKVLEINPKNNKAQYFLERLKSNSQDKAL
ncbi:MAG: hypothetical protein JNM57_02985 [Cyclobacteriaceae bacterium]|nr:hypothetical protein [Cyclobacteriaceae bacterium]